MRYKKNSNLLPILNSLRLQIFETSYLEKGNDWHFKHIVSPFNRLYFVKGGDASVRPSFDVGAYTALEPGKIYLIPLGRSFDYICQSHIEKLYIHFRLEVIEGLDLFELMRSNSATAVVTPLELKSHRPISEWRSLFNKAYESEEIADVLKFDGQLKELLASNVSFSLSSISALILHQKKYAEELQFIKQNLRHGLSIKDVSMISGKAEAKFSRDFRRDFGFSLKSYLLRSLTRKAQEKLWLSSEPINQIAAELGFDDVYYFSRFFKKYSGKTPSEFRQDSGL